MNENQLISLWINKLLNDHFKNEKKNNTEKIFLKITGLNHDNIKSLLDGFREKMDNFKSYYEPIIRTITPIPFYEEFAYQTNETSTWLRNNTKARQALVLVINEITPEAQSLESLFTIDESYLLSNQGLESLYEAFSENGFLSSAEINILSGFLKQYSKLSEPQLRSVLQFLVAVINESSPSIVDKIQNNLPHLHLFVDKKLQLNDFSKLKKNYDLANLQSGNRNLDTEQLQNKLYSYLEEQEKAGWVDDIWSSKSPEVFSSEAVGFLNNNEKAFLSNDFNFVEEVFNFKLKHSINEQLKEIIQENPFENEEKALQFKEGFNEVLENNNPDAIQEFTDEFEDVLNTKQGLVKKLTRIVEKLRNPSEYDDFFYGLIREIFIFIEEHSSNKDLNKLSFELSILTSKLPENIRALQNLYLKNINMLIPRLTFKETSIPKEDDLANKITDIAYNLSFYIGNKEIESKKFKVHGFQNLDVYGLFNLVKEGQLPYRQDYCESDVEIIDILSSTEEKIKPFLTLNEQQMKKHFKSFSNFSALYLEFLKIAIEDGISSLNIENLETELKTLLNNIYESTTVAKHLYQNINLIGVIDIFDIPKGNLGAPVQRKVTIFNPIRLVSFVKKYDELSKQIDEWITVAQDNNLVIEKLDEYLGFILEKTSRLAPRYFSTNNNNLFLIEQTEVFGEGVFSRSDKVQQSTATLVNELSSELVKTIKSYLEVYPYSKDGLDMLMLYCQDVDVVTKCIDEIFHKTKVNKLRLTVHSELAAKLHMKLNKWIEQKEEYRTPQLGSKFPKLELNVISGNNIHSIKDSIEHRMSDADLVVLADYFSRTNQIKSHFSKIIPTNSLSWFENIHKEPLNDNEAVKRESLLPERLPSVLQSFYQLQYMIETNIMPEDNSLYVLQNIISINDESDSALINFMHEKFNWVVILDKYLDKTLLIKASAQANIIQYKSKAGTTNNFKLIVSSSEYIRKLSEQTSDYAYYDRLHRKLVSILKNENVSREEVIEAVNCVKGISGALVLKVIGKGKYAHEMLATYLTVKRRSIENNNALQVWSSCDDLPWFANNKRRPDLVSTSIFEEDGRLHVNFELVELKFVNHNIFDRERTDALKQIKSGKNLFEKLFNFSSPQLDTDFWRSEFVQYLIEKRSYKPEHIYLLKKLQNLPVEEIEVTINGYADVYCYTSNLTDVGFEKIDDGVFLDKISSTIENYIYTRSYILNQLRTTEEKIPEYQELEHTTMDLLNESRYKIEPDLIDQSEQKNLEISSDGRGELVDSKVQIGEQKETEEKSIDEQLKKQEKVVEENFDRITPDKEEQREMKYPEQLALKGLDIQYDDMSDNNEELKNNYIKKLKLSFNQNNLHIGVKDSIIGSSVIRLNLALPSDLPNSKVTSRAKDIQIWLGLSSEPHIFIDKNGLNVDIVRENPETIYFEKFLQIVREQIQDEVTDTNLIAPLGLDPLNNVIYMDFSNSMSPHLLTGGTTGSGKSVTLNSIILGMMCLYSPEHLQFLFIDPKKVEFTMYENRQHTMDVITDIDEAVIKLNVLVEEMEKRYAIFAKEAVTNLEEYIKEVKQNMPRIVLVFDEFADFMTRDSETKKQVETAIQRLSQKARAAGIHLIICTQNPKADIINTNIRNNLGSRLALKAADATASTIILDDTGAEKLAGKGDFLAKVYGNIVRGKSPFLTAQVRRALLGYFSK